MPEVAPGGGLGKRIVHYGGVLFLVAAAAALSLGFMYRAARPRMDANAARRREEGRRNLFADKPSVDFEECVAEVKGPDGKTRRVTYWKVFQGGELVGYVAEGAAKGYSSTVRVLVRVDAARAAVEGIKVTSSAETPGLGERINEVKASMTLLDKLLGKTCEEGCPSPWFQEKFKGLPVKNVRFVSSPEEEEARKGVVAISGATVSSTAVLNAVKNAVETLDAVCGGDGGEDGGEGETE